MTSKNLPQPINEHFLVASHKLAVLDFIEVLTAREIPQKNFAVIITQEMKTTRFSDHVKVYYEMFIEDLG